MKKVILSLLVALIALPASAKEFEMSRNTGVWNGEMVGDANNMECTYGYKFWKNGMTWVAYRNWQTFDAGKSPFCPQTIHREQYPFDFWQHGAWSDDEVQELMDNGVWGNYKAIRNTENRIWKLRHAYTILVNSAGEYVEVRTDLLAAFITRVRIDHAESYDTFIANSTLKKVEPSGAEMEEARNLTKEARRTIYGKPTVPTWWMDTDCGINMEKRVCHGS